MTRQRRILPPTPYPLPAPPYKNLIPKVTSLKCLPFCNVDR